jgi:hypothetical protein
MMQGCPTRRFVRFWRYSGHKATAAFDCYLRNLLGVALGIFLIWFGLSAIDRGEGYALGLYVVVASIALGVLMAKVWGDD